MGLPADDAPALAKAVATASQRLWQATEPACAKLVGADEAARLGNEDCFTIILHHFSEGQWGSDAALVSNIRAGNTPMPAPDQLDALATRLLAMTDAVQGFEKDLGQTLGPELAEEIATGHAPWGCTMALAEGARTGAFPPK